MGEGASGGLIFSHRSGVFGLDYNFFVLGFYYYYFFLKIVLGFDFVLVS